MVTLLSSLAPAIVKIVFVIFDAIGVKKENKKKFLQAIINNSKDNVSVKLRYEYKDLLDQFKTKQDNDVF